MFIGYYLGSIAYNDRDIIHKANEIKLDIDYWGAFWKIFSNNIIVGMIISIAGFATGGIITVSVFAWNGFTLGLLYKSLQNNFIYGETIFWTHTLPHAPSEILAFCLFGCIGLKGYKFWNLLFTSSSINTKLIPETKEFFIPVILLFISALIETFISS